MEEKNNILKHTAPSDKEEALILWFEDLTNDDVAYVGGKNASLGEMYKELTPKGIKIPNGFAVTAYAYNHFLDECNLMDDLSAALEDAHIDNRDLKKVGKKVRKIILQAEFPDDLSKAILEAYKKLGGGDVAVRSSATAEDLPEASFAGQQESYLNVEGEEMILEACKKCMASLFTNRAISYREDKGYNHFDVSLSVGVMKMVRSDLACAGTMFTIDTETGFQNTVVINGNWGLGENVVQGSVNPDEWTVFKPTLSDQYKPLIRKVLGSKKQFMVYGGKGGSSTVNMQTSEEHQCKFCLEDDEVLQIAKWGVMIEEHYSKRIHHYCPMDIEWAKDGNTKEIFIVQARPETVQSQKNKNILVTYKLKGKIEADKETIEEITEENAQNMKKGGDKEAEKAKKKLGGDKEKGEKDKEGKSNKEYKKKGKAITDDTDEGSESEDDLKLSTSKKHKAKKDNNELIKESKKEGKGEVKEEEESKDKEKKKVEEKKKEKEEKKEEKEEKEEKDKYEADAGKIAMARHEEFAKEKEKKEGKGKEGEKEKEGKKDKKDKKDKKNKKDKKKEGKAKSKEAEEKILTTGAAVGSGVAAGKARKILSVSKLKEFNKGEILVTEMTDPDWEPILKLASAIVTDCGGRTCHAAIIARELGIPCIVGCSDATSKIETNDPVTIDCSRGDQGVVLEGIYKFEKIEQDLGEIKETKTKIMMNVADPDRALELSFIPNSGVGLGRLEFIINNHIGMHPLAALHEDRLSEEEKKRVKEKAKGYKDAKEYYVSVMSQGVAMIAAAFYPKPVIVRFSDFKTNEYGNLLGGRHFEPKEDNPMLGWRGASRYYDPTYRPGFALECEAMKRVREVFGLSNLSLMIPMLRTVDEAKRVLLELESNGIKRSEGEGGLKVIAMCEVPANCILAEQFLSLLDGFSIGSNDLTQMTLGVDRDSEIVNDIFDERNDAVKIMISHAIKVCLKLNKYVGICGQAPSDYPEFASWLVDEGIYSMSLNPDTVLSTSLLVYKRENEREKKDMEGKEGEKGKESKGEKSEKDKKEKVGKEGKDKVKEKKEKKKGKDKKEKKPKEKKEEKEKKIEEIQKQIDVIQEKVGGLTQQLQELKPGKPAL